jgi:hypothetical protein
LFDVIVEARSTGLQGTRRRSNEMTNHEPVKTVNLDQYGRDPLPWHEVLNRLEAEVATGKDTFTVLGTVTPDGRPHAAVVGAWWIDAAWYIVSGPGTRKARNLAHNPACTLSLRLPGVDMVFEGRAHRVTNAQELERVAAVYRDVGWPVTVDGDAFVAPYTHWTAQRSGLSPDLALICGGILAGSRRAVG